MNEWHRALRGKEAKRRNKKAKPIRDYSGGFSGNSHQRRKQRRAQERKKVVDHKSAAAGDRE